MEEENGEHRGADPAPSGDPADPAGASDDGADSAAAPDEGADDLPIHYAGARARERLKRCGLIINQVGGPRGIPHVRGSSALASRQKQVVAPLIGWRSDWRTLLLRPAQPPRPPSILPPPPPPPGWINHAWETEPSKPLEEAGIKVGEIIAWRCWQVSDGFLKSVAADAVWPITEPMTGDVKTAGVHAWKTERGALEYGRTAMTMGVVGNVALWGEVIEHEDGYRAEFAKVTSIDYAIAGERFSETPPAIIVARLRQRYGVSGALPVEPPPEPKPGVSHSAVPPVWQKSSAVLHDPFFLTWCLAWVGWLLTAVFFVIARFL